MFIPGLNGTTQLVVKSHFSQLPVIHRLLAITCAINWMILTKMLRGMSLGTTLRDPFGKSVVTMVLRRLGGM